MVTVNYTVRSAIYNVTGLYPATPDLDFTSEGGKITFDGRKQDLKVPGLGTLVVYPEGRAEAFEQFLQVTVTADGVYEERDEEFDVVLHDPVWYNYVYEYNFELNDGVQTTYAPLFASTDRKVRITTSVHAGKLGTLSADTCDTLPPPDDDDITECKVVLDITGEVVTIVANELRSK